MKPLPSNLPDYLSRPISADDSHRRSAKGSDASWWTKVIRRSWLCGSDRRCSLMIHSVTTLILEIELVEENELKIDE